MNEQLQNELEEQARLLGMSAERECALERELQAERALADRLAGFIDSIVRNILAALPDIESLERELQAERALADRLVKVVEHSAKIIGPPDSEHDSRWVTDDELDDLWNRTQSALAAWKEARND